METEQLNYCMQQSAENAIRVLTTADDSGNLGMEHRSWLRVLSI